MNDTQTTRRRFLVAAFAEDPDDLAVMSRFAQRLFPREGLADSE
ncbi:MAG: hypothetical protein OEM60_14125 [Gammaproteobacteria bacterium]|nr:hypothetical protein [Gammaproteobacteria bacterium]MDH3428379.1 hypothetical protein [Gammaproteobacteria bacterium]MDH3434998.1 hypothetical protein [Gammaproteobacteria bacterium]